MFNFLLLAGERKTFTFISLFLFRGDEKNLFLCVLCGLAVSFVVNRALVEENKIYQKSYFGQM